MLMALKCYIKSKLYVLYGFGQKVEEKCVEYVLFKIEYVEIKN